MPSINVHLKDGADSKQLESAKKTITDQGGKITREFTIVPGFSADIADDKVSALESNQHVSVERDGEVKTQ